MNLCGEEELGDPAVQQVVWGQQLAARWALGAAASCDGWHGRPAATPVVAMRAAAAGRELLLA